jgi:ribosomal protein L32
MDLGSLFLSLALLILVAAFVARPLIDQHGNSNDSAPADELVARREAVLIELRDLDFDHGTGKVNDDDYTAQRARLVANGAEVLRRLAAVKSATPDDDLEKMIAARRQARQTAPGAKFCPNCGEPLRSGDKFCAACGHKITAAAEPA